EPAARNVHARRVAPSFGEDAELSRELYHGALERRDVSADAEAHAREINQRVDDELSRSVIGHLAAAVDLHHRNLARGDEVRAARIEPEGEDRRVLEKPDLVRGRRIALAGEALHRAPGRLVLAKPGAADHGRAQVLSEGHDVDSGGAQVSECLVDLGIALTEP